MPELPDYILKNRLLWDGDTPNWVEAGERSWGQDSRWGTFRAGLAASQALSSS